MKIILHIGMPKCGSSAVQTFLSSRNFGEASGGRCAYVSLREGGVVISGDELVAKASAAPRSYNTSCQGKVISGFSAKERKLALSALKELGSHFDTLVLSKEGWGVNPEHLVDDCIFSCPDFEVDVLFYVRPQVEWLNSAWWQWGAWMDIPLCRWIKCKRENACWHDLYQQWHSKPWVRQVNARLLGGDVVQDFMGYLGYVIEPQVRSNQSLPEIVLRLFQRHRELRPSAHKSAIDFVLARHLQLDQGKSPWILDREQVVDLLGFYRPDNEQLAQVLPAALRAKMLDDPRWWQLNPYLQRTLSELVVDRVNETELKQLATAALGAVKRLDAELPKTVVQKAFKNRFQQPVDETVLDGMKAEELEQWAVSTLEAINRMDNCLRKLMKETRERSIVRSVFIES